MNQCSCGQPATWVLRTSREYNPVTTLHRCAHHAKAILDDAYLDEDDVLRIDPFVILLEARLEELDR